MSFLVFVHQVWLYSLLSLKKTLYSVPETRDFRELKTSVFISQPHFWFFLIML